MGVKVCVLMGSPRPRGNTAALLQPFCEELKRGGGEVERFDLYRKNLQGCLACRSCQQDWNGFGCVIEDDMQEIFSAVESCDLLVLATPIYSWSCTAPLKAVLDRLVYGMNKFYGSAKGPALWQGKGLALLLSCGYAPQRGTDLFEEGMRRYAKHSALTYLGAYTARHKHYDAAFMNETIEAQVRAFARELTAWGE